MLLTNGDAALSRAVANIGRNQNNVWKNAVYGEAPPELNAEWASVTSSGFGQQKKLNLFPDFIGFLNFLSI